MKILKFLIIIFIFLFPHNINADTKIVFIDIDFLIKNTNFGKLSLKKIENLNNKNINMLKENEKKIKKEENLLLQKKDIISKDEFENEVKILKTKIKEFKTNKEILVKDFNKFKNQELNNTLEKFNKIIQEYMSQNSIEIVLNKNNIFIGKVSSDITNDILVEINKVYK